MPVELFDYQLSAVRRMKNGCILCGGVGSGKSRTALAYYYLESGGEPSSLADGEYDPMDDVRIKDLYIITTARKRDTLEWDGELSPFLMSTHRDINLYCNKVIVDSWNNIAKYAGVIGAFFIFDEQRVAGSGVWVKSFLKIARGNSWILLSATPGDTWADYIPVFIANGFYRNRTEFNREHVVYSHFSNFPQVDRYVNTGKLLRLRRDILVTMDFRRETVAHHKNIYVEYDAAAYRDVSRTRRDPYKDEPVMNAAGLCYIWRRIVNSDPSRGAAVLEIFENHPKVIIFYNFDYELEILRGLDYGGAAVAEWNGHKHEPIPEADSWVYMVQYSAGCEGWNCVATDAVIFYSQNYSYKTTTQAAGRIDRLNTPYADLYYYHILSRSGIDFAIARALKNKESFNEGKFVKVTFE
jgi:hypothetical protein